MHSEDYCSWICLSVGWSVKPHLTSGVSVHLEIDVMYLMGNEGQSICGDFSETTLLQRSSTSCIVLLPLVGHFRYAGKKCMRMPRLLAGGVRRHGLVGQYMQYIEGLHFSAFHFLSVEAAVVNCVCTCTCIYFAKAMGAVVF